MSYFKTKTSLVRTRLIAPDDLDKVTIKYYHVEVPFDKVTRLDSKSKGGCAVLQPGETYRVTLPVVARPRGVVATAQVHDVLLANGFASAPVRHMFPAGVETAYDLTFLYTCHSKVALKDIPYAIRLVMEDTIYGKWEKQ